MSKLDSKAKMGVLYLVLVALTVPVSVAFVVFSVSNNSSKKINAQTPSVNICDFNRDGKVDGQDYSMAAAGFGKVNEALGNAVYDLDRDGWINSKDLDAVSSADPIACNK